MTGLVVDVELGSPLAVGRLPYGPTLDSVCMALLAGPGTAPSAELVADLAEVIDISPDGLPSASALWPDSEATHGGDVHPRVPMTDDWVVGAAAQGGTGPWRTRVHLARWVWARQWQWWADGDAGRLERLLAGLTSLGARRGSGYGAVASVHVSEGPAGEWSVVGSDEMTVARPIPMRLLDATLEAAGTSRVDLDPGRYATVELPIWPAPSWGPGPSELHLIPVCEEVAA